MANLITKQNFYFNLVSKDNEGCDTVQALTNYILHKIPSTQLLTEIVLLNRCNFGQGIKYIYLSYAGVFV